MLYNGIILQNGKKQKISEQNTDSIKGAQKEGIIFCLTLIVHLARLEKAGCNNGVVKASSLV